MTLAIATIAFNQSWCIAEQIRLFEKYLRDDHTLIVYDNSDNAGAAQDISTICRETGTPYVRLTPPQHLHHYALNIAARDLDHRGNDYYGWVDHDVFPACETELIPLIEPAGFLALSQRHHPTQVMYPWPGFFFLSRTWLAGRHLNFDGIRARDKKDDGDTGSGLHTLFHEDDWGGLPKIAHGYQSIRPSDGYGTQSHSIESIGDFKHLTNASGWFVVPKADEREAILRRIIADL